MAKLVPKIGEYYRSKKEDDYLPTIFKILGFTEPGNLTVFIIKDDVLLKGTTYTISLRHFTTDRLSKISTDLIRILYD